MVAHHFIHSAMRALTDAGVGIALSSLVKRMFGGSTLPPNVLRGEDGKLLPAPGYAWVSAAEGEFAVRWVPGKLHPGQSIVAGTVVGQWTPCAGYAWVSPDDPVSAEVRWEPGAPHPTALHVVAAPQEGKWRAADGYRWVSRDADDLRVEPAVGSHGGDISSASFDATRLQRIKDLATLGLDEGVGWEEVEAAFRRLVKVHHPDRFVGAARDAAESSRRAFLLLRDAYDRLKSAWRH